MKRHFSIGATLLGLLFAASASAQWVDIKDPNELRALFSNKTFKGTNAGGDVFTAYNRADGTRLLVIPQSELTQKWKVTGSDQVCTESFDGSTNCNTYQKHASNRDEYRARRVKDGTIVSFKVTEGIKGARKF